jgi:hypothetical protein
MTYQKKVIIMVKKIIEKINSDDLWESVPKNHEFIEGAHSLTYNIGLSQNFA